MTTWTIETEVNSRGEVVYDVIGRGNAKRRRKQDLDSLEQAIVFVRRYGEAGDTVKLVEPDGYRRSLPVWTRRRFSAISQ